MGDTGVLVWAQDSTVTTKSLSSLSGDHSRHLRRGGTLNHGGTPRHKEAEERGRG